MGARRQGPGLARARAFPGGNVAELLPATRPRPGDSRDLGRGSARLPSSPVWTCPCVVPSGEGTSRAGRAAVVARAERKCRAGRGSRRRRAAHPFRFQHFAQRRPRRVVRVLRESRSRDTPTAPCRVPTRDEHLAECGTSVSPAGGRVCTAAASGGSFAALHASRLPLQHLWAAAAAVLSILSARGVGGGGGFGFG